MSRHQCKGEQCGTCADRIDAAEEARNGRPRGYADRELDQLADGAAADMVFGREW